MFSIVFLCFFCLSPPPLFFHKFSNFALFCCYQPLCVQPLCVSANRVECSKFTPQNLPKFGQCARAGPGPESGVTMVSGDVINLRLAFRRVKVGGGGLWAFFLSHMYMSYTYFYMICSCLFRWFWTFILLALKAGYSDVIVLLLLWKS